MTWHFEATIAADIHRVSDAAGRRMWGVEHRRAEEFAGGEFESATVGLPTGETSLLLVPPLAGGLVIDVVRAFHGLTEAEVRTLVAGCLDELVGADDARLCLSLECFGLDEEGRPRLIPGVRRDLETSVRRGIGEMAYHAAYGSSWAQSLLPVEVALESHSRELRALVGDLLTEATPGQRDDVGAVLAEVRSRLDALPAPVPLPLVPAARDLDPALALTARLRATTGRPLPRRTESGAAGDRSTRGGRGLHRAAPARSTLPVTLRGLLSRRPLSSRSAAALGLAAAAAAVVGGIVIVDGWSATEDTGSRPVAESASAPVSDAAIADRLVELSTARAEALEAGDAEALAALTVPSSAAARADELIDLASYSGGTYTIALSGVVVEERGPDSVRIAARMTSSARTADGQSRFDAGDVVFTLTRHEGEWKVAEVSGR